MDTSPGSRRPSRRLRSLVRLISACMAFGALCGTGCTAGSLEDDAARLVDSLGGRLQRDHDGTIVSIDLSGTSVQDSDLQAFRRLSGLKILKLGATGISDDGLTHVAAIHSLEDLSLWGAPVTNAGLQRLFGLKRLARVTCDYTQVSASGLRRLQAELPDCKVEWDRWD